MAKKYPKIKTNVDPFFLDQKKRQIILKLTLFSDDFVSSSTIWVNGYEKNIVLSLKGFELKHMPFGTSYFFIIK